MQNFHHIQYVQFYTHSSTVPTDADGRRTCLLTVPNFDQTHSCVLVNLKTLKCSEVQFCTSLSPSVSHPMDTGDTHMAAEPEEVINYMDLYEDDNDDDIMD